MFCNTSYSMPGLTSLEADKEPSVAVEEAITHWSLGQVGMVVRLHHLRGEWCN